MNEEKVSGLFDQAKGKLKQAFGEATGDESVANSGVVDQVKGNVKEAWGNVKDTAHNLNRSEHAEETRADAERSGHAVRNSIANAAENAKESINRGLEHLRNKAND